ncbi:MAG: hypothetical protein ACNA8J_00980 [Gammaproteobacteria bacterium]
MRSLYSVALAAIALALAGCLSDAKDPDAPSPGTGNAVPDLPVVGATFRAQFDPLKAIMPYPNDILGFVADAAADGTLNLPAQPLQPLAPLVNQLDGFSTNARIQANFTRRVDPASLNPSSVFLLEVAIDPSTKGVVGLSDATLCKLAAAPEANCAALGLTFNTGNPFLVQGTDYAVGVAPDIDAGGQTIQLEPLRPLNSNRANLFSAGTENGYLLILTDGIRDTQGNRARPDATYAQIRAGFLAGAIQLPAPGESLPPGLSTEQLLGIFIAAQLTVGEFLGISPETVVVTASFTTQDTRTVLQTAAEMAAAGESAFQPLAVPVPLPDGAGGTIAPGTQLTTTNVLVQQNIPLESIPAGEGDVYTGYLEIPYYLSPPTEADPSAPLNAFWVAASDQPSRALTKFNPVPLKRADVQIPLKVTVPNANTAYAQATTGGLFAPKPPEGWPVVIFQHGITRNRLDVFAVTNPLNNAGYVVISLDQPLHGIAAPAIDFANTPPEELGEIIAANPTALFRVAGVPERTFDLDVNGDGQIDASGTHFINLSNGLVSRDNLRQAGVDLVALTRSIGSMDIDGDGTPDLDASRVHFIGVSLGAIAGTTYLSVAGVDAPVTATLGVAGGRVSDLLLDSFSFGPVIEAGLSAQGLVPNTSLYNNFIRDLQSLVDAGDPISHAAAASGASAIHFIQVDNDQVVPNSASNRLAAEMRVGGLTDYDYETAPVLDPSTGLRGIVEPGGAIRGRVCFTDGASHGSQLDPGSTAASATVTGEMQAQQVVFIAGVPSQLPGNGQALVFGASGSPLTPTVYGNFDDDCNAPGRRDPQPAPDPEEGDDG